MQYCFLRHGYLMVIITWGFPDGSVGKKSTFSAGDTGDAGQEDPLEKEKATHASILAWKISWIEDPGGLESTGSQRIRHSWATKPACHLIIVVNFLVILLLKFSIIFGRSWITWKWIWFKCKISPYTSIYPVRNGNMLRQMISKGWNSCLSFPTPWEVLSTWGRC